VTGALVGVLLLLVITLAVALAHTVARQRAGRAEAARDERDAASEPLVAGLTAELRKWQAEAEHWKATAQRLQRELDQRP
jgi:flagellar biosynthesis/type III secretory pathway M-ring protein FliF/YscJ